MKKVISWVVAASLLLCIFFVDAAPISYAAEQPLTIGQTALLLMDVFDLEYSDDMTKTIPDVSESSPYYEAVCACVHMGIISLDTVNYGINNPIYRSEFVIILRNAGLSLIYPDTIPSNLSSSSYCYNEFCAVLAHGIMNVDENGLFERNGYLYTSDINMSALEAAFEPTTTSAANLDLVNGSITIWENAKGVTGFIQGETEIRTTAGAGIVRQSDNTTATKNSISINRGNVSLTVSDLNVAPDSASPISVENGASLTLTLLGENILTAPNEKPGIRVFQDAELVIRGTGFLEATGGWYAAGIGGGQHGGTGSVSIENGSVTATGGWYGPGIGGAYYEGGGIITISGGTVTATAGGDGTSNYIGGAGIGGIRGSDGGIITITGGTVYAIGSKTGLGSNTGAGIGGGYGGDGGVITITGGTVYATGGCDSAGIGGGRYGSGGIITISGGTVTATSIYRGAYDFEAGLGYGAGIGGGVGGTGGVVKISNANVTASGSIWAIGSGGVNAYNEFGCTSIDIEDDATVNLAYDLTNGYGQCLEKITVNKQPFDAVAHIGNRAKFSLDAYGYSGLSYQWQVSSDNITWVDIEGQTLATASIPLSDANNGHYYRCKLTNGWGNVIYSESAQAHVLAFTKQPISVDAALDDIVSFAVSSSSKDVKYQWQRSYDNGATWFDVDGETYATLIVNATLSTSSAKYRCVITAPNGDTLASDIVEIKLDTGNMVTYTVQHFKQKADGSGYVLSNQEVLDGVSGETATAPVASYDGFSENTSKSEASGTIANDSSLILTRYFDRNTYSLSFEMNGGSAIPAIEALYEATVTAPDEPSRYGYTFAGWYADADFEEEYVFDTMPLGGATAYAKWELIGADRGVEYHINGLSLRSSENYETLDSIPNTAFFVEVSVTNLSADATDTIIIATYKENGQFVGMQYLYAKSQVGQTLTFGSYIDNTKGDIAKIKAFVLPTLGSPIPLANSAEVK